jgi:mono/diheme cytochrome c family protein
MKITIAFGCLLTAASLAAQDSRQAAHQEETRACIQCHGLRLIHSQRLSAAAWGKEIDKMIGWGAEVKNRQLLLDYLAAEYPDTKPLPDDPKSADGRKR